MEVVKAQTTKGGGVEVNLEGFGDVVAWSFIIQSISLCVAEGHPTYKILGFTALINYGFETGGDQLSSIFKELVQFIVYSALTCHKSTNYVVFN